MALGGRAGGRAGDGDGDGRGGDDGRTFPAHPGSIPKASRDQISRKGNPSLRRGGLHNEVRSGEGQERRT